MNEILSLFEYYEKEKGIHRSTMVEALEGALLAASRKSIGPARELRITVDPEKGHIKAMATLIVVDRVENPYDEVDIFTARRINPEINVDDEMDLEVTPANFGRIAAQTAKQAMVQRLRQAEKELIYEEFKDRAGDIVSGTVRRFDRSDVMIDLGKFEGTMNSRERVSTEEYNIGDRIRAYVVAVENGARGPEIILSRSHPNFVRRLFESEVSEIADRTVEIKALAREAGYRTKVAVWSADEKVDPVGACVGLRGARVKNIVRELNNEKVDIIRWSDDVDAFVRDALKPALIRSITLNEEEKKVRVTVDEEELSKAIGRRGQNARLTARLVGWDVQVEKDESAAEALAAQLGNAASVLVEKCGVDVETAQTLVMGGVNSVEVLTSGVDAIDLIDILGITEEEGNALLEKARKQAGVEAEVEAPAVAEPEPESEAAAENDATAADETADVTETEAPDEGAPEEATAEVAETEASDEDVAEEATDEEGATAS